MTVSYHLIQLNGVYYLYFCIVITPFCTDADNADVKIIDLHILKY